MPRERSIDHVVVAVQDLDSAARAYEALGFGLTPRAYHSDRMGTSNRLIQFAGRNFIELLEVDRPEGLDAHAFNAVPPRTFLEEREGLSMLVLTSDDARADLAHFAALGLSTYAPFDFERQAKLPDGSQVTLTFSLGFVTCPTLPGMAFFVCQNHKPQYFWKPEYQSHRNGAQSIAAVYIAAHDPGTHVRFLSRLTGGTSEPIDGGHRISCGGQELLVVTPERLRAYAVDSQIETGAAARFAGLSIVSTARDRQAVPAADACGLFIDWRQG
jgi:catechol 2,3-dioxygenase-like lactoylglutathione lyase family enzyme